MGRRPGDSSRRAGNAERARKVSGYDSGIYSAFNATVVDVNSGGGHPGIVAPADALRLMEALGGDVFLLGFMIGAIVSIVMLFLSEFMIGIGLLVGIALTLLGLAAGSVTDVSLPVALTATLVADVDAAVNTSYPANAGLSQQADWDALSQSISVSSDVVTLPIDLYLANVLVTKGVTSVWPSLTLALDFGAIALDGIGFAQNSLELAVASEVLSDEGIAIALSWPNVPSQLKPLNQFTFVLSLASAAASGRDVAHDLGYSP